MNVYLIREEGTTFYKIGKANNPLTRLRDLQTSHARTLTLVTSVAVGSNALKKEAILHAKYNEYRVNGEWFDFPDQLIDEVKFDLLNELQICTENTIEELKTQETVFRVVLNIDPESDNVLIEELKQILKDGQFKSYPQMIVQLLRIAAPALKNHPMFSIEAARQALSPRRIVLK